MAWGDREEILNLPNESINRDDINPATMLRRIFPGSGILLAGTGIGDETISVDDTKFVPSSRTLVGGTGIAGIGDLSANRYINIDQAAALTWTGVHTHNANINMGAGYTVDGRDVSADGAKLDGIESGATADQTITAGTGLVGGGTGDVTLHVGAGDGIQLAADTVGVDSTVVRTSRTLTAGSHLSGGGDLSLNRRFDVTPSTIPHDGLSGFVANEHINHTGVTITAGTGLTGGGDIAASRTLSVASPAVLTTRAINAGDGLTGGGSLAADRTLAVDSTVVRTSRTLTAGSYLSGGGDLSLNRRFDVQVGQIPHQSLSGAGTNTHTQIDSHIGSTSNPHSVTAAQVGRDTAQWNADRLQGRTVASDAPSDGQALIWDNAQTRWEPGTPDKVRAHVAKVRRSTAQTIANNTTTAIQFDVEEFDTDDWVDLTTNNDRITVDRAGYYLVVADVVWTAGFTASRVFAYLQHNTGNVCYNELECGNSATYLSHAISTIVSASPNDYFRVLVKQNSGASQSTLGNFVHLAVTYLGG